MVFLSVYNVVKLKFINTTSWCPVVAFVLYFADKEIEFGDFFQSPRIDRRSFDS